MSTPSNMKAIKVEEAKKASLVSDAKLPSLRPDYVLVKVSCVALNPTDWKHIDFLPTAGATVGCDYSGTVVEIGPEVKKHFSKGDRIAGFCHGVNSDSKDDGCFGEYAVAKADISLKIPEGVSDEDASTMGVGITTIGQGLYQSLKLPLPDSPSNDKTPVLIYGGSTTTGLFALQWAKLSGLTVITTCSPRNFDLVKSYGADAAFDYSNADECSKKIREYTNNNLRHAFDCISEKGSPEICANAISSAGGAYSSLLPVKELPRSDVTNAATLAYTALNESFSFRGTEVPAKPQDLEFGRKVWALAEKLLGEGKFRVPPVGLREGGLEGIFGGLDELRQGKVSGTKLVYRVGGAA